MHAVYQLSNFQVIQFQGSQEPDATQIFLMEQMQFTFFVLVVSTILIFKCANGQERTERWKRSTSLTFNDPGYPQQFYLNDKFGVTMNIKKAWSKGYTGKNVTICIVYAHGVDYKHDDLLPRFKLAGSYNYYLNITDPSPVIQNFDIGTGMAGLAAGQANNGKCGVGVAYDAYITGIQTFKYGAGVHTSYKIMADSLAFGNQISDIYSYGWTPMSKMLNHYAYMAPNVKASVKNGAEKGRGGKGNIYVFENGHDGFGNGTCGYDEYISSIYTISISLVTGKNERLKNDMQCTGVSAAVYGVNKNDHYLMPTCANNNQCQNKVTGSTGSVAVASGMLALVLQANPNLGWRDVQHLIVRSSSSAFPSVTWKTNKAGIRVSDAFGFGLLDADALTENAKNWTNVGRHLECVVDYRLNERIDGIATTVKSIDLTAWPRNCGGESQRINFLEHVLLVVSFNYTTRKLVEIEIEAPTGTKSLILRSGRKRDDLVPGVKDLSILSLHHWGENPKGIWRMRLRNVKPNSTNSGNLLRWGFKFYGTKDDPLTSNTIKPSQIRANVTPHANTASPANPGTSPTVSGIWTNAISGTAGATRKVPTTTNNGSGPVLKSCKWMILAYAILLWSFIWEISY